MVNKKDEKLDNEFAVICLVIIGHIVHAQVAWLSSGKPWLRGAHLSAELQKRI
jgi:hypothetical protein